jgi:integrase
VVKVRPFFELCADQRVNKVPLITASPAAKLKG